MLPPLAVTGSPLITVVVLICGLAVLAFAIWSRRGRSEAARWWLTSSTGPGLILVALPALGLIVSGTALSMLGVLPGLLDPVLGVVVIVGVLAIFLSLFGLVPRFLRPRWYRDHQAAARERQAATPEDGAEVGPGQVVTSSQEAVLAELRAHSDGYVDPVPLENWAATWIHDPEADRREHPSAPIGGCSGHLMLHPGQLSFAATRHEDTMRGHPTLLTVPTTDITTIRVVPAGAGADGVRRAGRLGRSLFKRLVIDTDTDSHLFDVRDAGRVADRLRSETGAT